MWLINELNGVLHCFQQYFSHITATAHIICAFLGFTITRLGLRSVLPKDPPTKKPRGSSLGQTQDPWITGHTIHHAHTGPHKNMETIMTMTICYHTFAHILVTRRKIHFKTSKSRSNYLCLHLA